MKTLVVCYSKTGNTKKVADAVVKKLNGELDLLQFDEASNTVQASCNPAEYDRVILLSPIWAFSLAEPMKLYLARHKADIKAYSLIVTCAGLGLFGCKRNCKAAIGKLPETAIKLRAADVKSGNFSIDAI